MKKHYNITITGKVQGVGFRYNTLNIAKKLEVKGFVKNMPDGSVYIEAESEHAILEKFIEQCKTLQPYATIRKLNFSESNILNYKNFEIRY